MLLSKREVLCGDVKHRVSHVCLGVCMTVNCYEFKHVVHSSEQR